MIDLSDEDRMTEITIAPDGRVFVFGLSREALEVLSELGPGDAHARRLLQHVREASGNSLPRPVLRERAGERVRPRVDELPSPQPSP